MILATIFVAVACTASSAVAKIRKLEEIFPPEYDKYEPPFLEDEPVHVYIQISVLDIDKIDDGAMEFSLQCYFVEFWKDYRLNLSIFQESSDVSIFPSYLVQHLWVPGLEFGNMKKGVLFHLPAPYINVKVINDGTIFRSSRYNLIIGCHMDFHFYPVDTQKCFLKIATFTYPDSKVLLHWANELPSLKLRSLLFFYVVQPLKYNLSELQSDKITEKWGTGNFTYLYANFTFARRISGSLFNVYFPSTLVVLLSWISFWLDVEAVPGRITLGVTSLLTLATQIVQAHAGLPTISYMTALDVWLFACLFTVFSSLIEFAISYQLFIRSKQRDMTIDCPQEARRTRLNENNAILGSISGQKLFLCGSLGGKSARCKKFPRRKTCQKSLDKICRKVFPFLFCLFSIIYWVYCLLLK